MGVVGGTWKPILSFWVGMTRRLARRLVQDAQVMPIQAVSRRHRISWHLIMGLVTDWSGLHTDSATPSEVSGAADRRNPATVMQSGSHLTGSKTRDGLLAWPPPGFYPWNRDTAGHAYGWWNVQTTSDARISAIDVYGEAGDRIYGTTLNASSNEGIMYFNIAQPLYRESCYRVVAQLGSADETIEYVTCTTPTPYGSPWSKTTG